MLCNQFQMNKYESPQVNLPLSSFFQRIKDGIVSPLAIKLGLHTALQPVLSPINHSQSFLKLQKLLKAQLDQQNEQMSRLQQERKTIMREISASHDKINQVKQDVKNMKMEMQELNQQLLFEQKQNFAAIQEIKRIEQQKEEEEEENQEDQEVVLNQEEEDILHYNFLSMHKFEANRILTADKMDEMDEMDEIDISQHLSFIKKRINLGYQHKIYQMDSQEDFEMEVQKVD